MRWKPPPPHFMASLPKAWRCQIVGIRRLVHGREAGDAPAAQADPGGACPAPGSCGGSAVARAFVGSNQFSTCHAAPRLLIAGGGGMERKKYEASLDMLARKPTT
jgi:hypothetical protein